MKKEEATEKKGRAQRFLPHLSVDCVIFGYHDGHLRVLLLKWKNSEVWALAGGRVMKDEDVDSAAARVLYERARLEDIFLRQFHTFGAVERVTPADYEDTFAQLGYSKDKAAPLLDRTVTVGYYALVDHLKVSPQPDVFADGFEWRDVKQLHSLVFDHNNIVGKALETLRHAFQYEYLGQNLLPAEFTMPELQRLYETILDHPLDRANFQKRMLSSGHFERVGKRQEGKAHKSPYLYRFITP